MSTCTASRRTAARTSKSSLPTPRVMNAYNSPITRVRPEFTIRRRFQPTGNIACSAPGVNGAGNLYRASLFGEPKIEPVTSRQWVVAGLGKPQTGLAAVSVGTPSRSGDYWLMDEANGTLVKQLTYSNSWQDDIALSEPEDLWLDCLDGNGRVHGWVLPPQNREPGKRYPAVLYIHGGPHPFYAYGFDYEHQTLAGAGFAVLYCNPRGSSSYGREHESMKKAYDGSAYIDLLQFVDTACRTV